MQMFHVICFDSDGVESSQPWLETSSALANQERKSVICMLPTSNSANMDVHHRIYSDLGNFH